jgi:hypothetical protein
MLFIKAKGLLAVAALGEMGCSFIALFAFGGREARAGGSLFHLRIAS